MANIAITEHFFNGSKEDIEKLKGIFESFEEKHNGEPLGVLAEELGINTDGINLRGNIEEWYYDENGGTIFLLTTSAWDSCMGFFKRMNKELFDYGLDISYRMEELGNAIFEVHDEGSFFPERFYVSAYCEDEVESCDNDSISGEYSTMDEVFKTWCRIIGKNAEEFGEDLTDAKKMDIINDYEDYNGENTYFGVYEFLEV